MRQLAGCLLLTIGILAAPASASIVKVSIFGTVEWNQVTAPPFGGNGPGSAVTTTFLLDSTVFTNSPNFPTRGYAINQASYQMKVGSATVGLQNPFPVGETPYFVIRNNDPAVDGFFISTNLDLPFGIPLDAQGVFGKFREDFKVTYGGGELSSLDILGAVGTYDFTGLQVFNWVVVDGGFEPIGILFDHMTIEVVPAPGAGLALVGAAACLRRRRR